MIVPDFNHQLGLALKDVFKDCGALRDLIPYIQFEKRKKTHGGVVLLVELEVETFFKLHKWYQITQNMTGVY